MKRLFLLFAGIVISVMCSAQVVFEKGCFVKKSGERLVLRLIWVLPAEVV